MLISPSTDAEAVSEFVYWIAQRGDGAKIIREHVRGEQDNCVACGRRWPCGLRRCAERSFRLRPYPDPPRCGPRRAGDGAVTIWRGETFWSDGLRYRARWFGRADYPDADAACWWLAITLETLRHRQEADGSGCFWGEVTAGQMANRPDGDGTVVLVGDWRPVEERGATATAYLRAAVEPITWGDRPE